MAHWWGLCDSYLLRLCIMWLCTSTFSFSDLWIQIRFAKSRACALFWTPSRRRSCQKVRWGRFGIMIREVVWTTMCESGFPGPTPPGPIHWLFGYVLFTFCRKIFIHGDKHKSPLYIFQILDSVSERQLKMCISSIENTKFFQQPKIGTCHSSQAKKVRQCEDLMKVRVSCAFQPISSQEAVCLWQTISARNGCSQDLQRAAL